MHQSVKMESYCSGDFNSCDVASSPTLQQSTNEKFSEELDDLPTMYTPQLEDLSQSYYYWLYARREYGAIRGFSSGI